jgi:thermitase
VVKVPAGQEQKYARDLANQPGVEFVEPNYIVTADLIPDDTLWSQQYGPTRIQAPAAWDMTTGSSNVIVAVLDSGIDASHPEFAGRILPGYDFVDDDSPWTAAGTERTWQARSPRREQRAGVAGWLGSRIMPLRVLGEPAAAPLRTLPRPWCGPWSAAPG